MGESGRVCQWILADGKICGLPIGGGSPRACKLHANAGNITSINDTKEHLQKNTRDYIDLTRLRFTGVFFDKSLFSSVKLVKFDGTEFVNCTFDQCSFFNASFGILERRCRFENSQFQGCWFRGEKCSFHGAEFVCEKTIFSGCMFLLEGSGTRPTRTLDFSQCSVVSSGEIFNLSYVQCNTFTMEGATVNGGYLTFFVYDVNNDIQPGLGLSLNGVGLISFSGLRFNGRFVYKQSPHLGRYGPILFLSGINFAEMSSAQFFDANLSGALFTNSIIEAIRFHNPVWPKEQGRLILYDQIERNSRTDISTDDIKELTRLYVQLKKNYELDRNFIDAGDWFHREMECRRGLLNQDPPKNPFRHVIMSSFFSLYHFVSEYGENYVRPLAFILLLWALFAPIYLFTGFAVGGESIEYYICPECSLSIQILWDLLKALVFSGGTMLLQLGRSVTPLSSWTTGLAVCQVLLTLALVPLFLLALRRKFRR